MRAIVIREPGGPEVLELREMAEPPVPHAHVRVAVEYIGVNRADLLQRMGRYPAPAGAPQSVPGLEYAGRVEALGPDAARFALGDRVHGIVAGGAYAELLVVHERELARVPDTLRSDAAAAVPEAFVTALDALTARGATKPGDRVLVHAAGSGVGTAAVQLAARLCAASQVLGTSRTAEKLTRAAPLGLDTGLVPTDGAFADAVIEATNGAGVDVVIDLVGGAYVAESLRCAALGARLVVVGLTGGRRADLDLGELLRRRATIVGTVLRSRPLEEKIAAATLLERGIDPALARSVLVPVIDRVFPLEGAAEAHAYVASDASFGKVLLRTSLGEANEAGAIAGQGPPAPSGWA